MAGTLSGGEQQMLAIGRGLMARPKLMMLDEPSLGLAPLVVEEIFRILSELNSLDITLLLIEQNARAALKIATRGYVMETGKIIMEGKAEDLLENEHVVSAYLGG
jgi:branched-chain amino acid transport system ATP-binding protein